eukprot:CAMPEP_0180149928 /NCGR_PEP_ID=MMETSP0986-20121125/21122_1 /TAXON_ID=697907 /ORGANISM="non described non described, Strain CCMP2293" /LENGTH=48 /DNA_ID= /DNA_START= /DNA_END= /DNA_ORIENTATION=
MLSALFEKVLPAYGSYEYSKQADDLGLGTNVTFGQHARPTADLVHLIH